MSDSINKDSSLTEICQYIIGMDYTNMVKVLKDIESPYYMRVTMEDGKAYALTMDMDFNRIDVVIKNGKIIKT